MDTLGGNDFIMGCLFLFIWQMMESLERLQAVFGPGFVAVND